MKELTFQLVRGRSWTSKIIGYFGAGYYSHIDVLTPTGLLRGSRSDEIMGIPPGYMDRPQNYEKWERQTRYILNIDAIQYEKYWQFSDKQLGKPYDRRGLLNTFVFGRDWREDDSWWCSEEVARNGEYAGLWEIPPEVNNVDPGDCAFLFAGKGAWRVELGQ